MNITFNETEKVAIATIIFKLVGTDRTYEKEELRYMQNLCINHNIPLIIPTGSRIGYEQAVKQIQTMTIEQKTLVGTILQGLAECDSDLSKEEMQLIEKVLG